MRFIFIVEARGEKISDIEKYIRSEDEESAYENKRNVSQEVDESTLTIWINLRTPRPFHRLFDRFQQDTGWKLNIRRFGEPFESTVLTKWEGGETGSEEVGLRPDIIDFHMTTLLYPADNWFSRLSPEENLIDLSDMEFISKTKYNLLDPVTLDNGKVWGPVIVHPIMIGVVYNKKVFKENDFDIPGNFEEFFNLCEKIKKTGISPLYAAWNDYWNLNYAVMFCTDGIKDDPNWWHDIITGKTDFSQPAIYNGYNAIKKFADAEYFQPFMKEGTYKKSHGSLMNDEVAMVFQNDRYLKDLVRFYGLENVNEKIGMFGLSMNSNTVSWVLHSPGAIYAVPKTGNPEKEKGARDFIDYVTGPGYQEFIDDLQIPPVLEGFEMPEITIDAYREILVIF